MYIELNKWNELISYGHRLCHQLKENGYDVELRSYTLYDGRRGLSMQVLDKFGCVFKEYFSGVGTYEMMSGAMAMNVQRIAIEC